MLHHHVRLFTTFSYFLWQRKSCKISITASSSSSLCAISYCRVGYNLYGGLLAFRRIARFSHSMSCWYVKRNERGLPQLNRTCHLYQVKSSKSLSICSQRWYATHRRISVYAWLTNAYAARQNRLESLSKILHPPGIHERIHSRIGHYKK